MLTDDGKEYEEASSSAGTFAYQKMIDKTNRINNTSNCI
jgi:hypothetical protein